MPSLAPEIFDSLSTSSSTSVLSGVLYRKVSPQVISELDGTHTGAVVLYDGFDEEA